MYRILNRTDLTLLARQRGSDPLITVIAPHVTSDAHDASTMAFAWHEPAAEHRVVLLALRLVVFGLACCCVTLVCTHSRPALPNEQGYDGHQLSHVALTHAYTRLVPRSAVLSGQR
jgi:hypothetical protein